MSNILRGTRFAVLPLMLLAGWIYLWTSSHSVDTMRQNETLALLKNMKQLDASWTADVLRSHADVNPNYDALTAPLQLLEDDLAQLRARSDDLQQPDISSSVDALAKAIDTKAGLIDDFKAQNSLFKNSLRYVPTAYHSIRTESGGGFSRLAGIGLRLEYLVNRTMRYSAVPDGEAPDALLVEIEDLRTSIDAMPAVASAPLLNLLAHVETLLKLRSKQVVLLRAISAVDVSGMADTLAALFGQLYSKELMSQFRAQRLLLAYSAFALLLVIGGTGFIGYRHATERRRLRRLVEEKTLELKDLATRDELTRVYNRRHVSELLRQMLAHHARSGEPLCIALLDIDHFKSVNDCHGHAAGDRVLQRFATIAARTLRTIDILGRWGGEEFLVVLPNTSLEKGQIALRRVREAILDAVSSDTGDALPVTFSGGLVLVPQGASIASVVDRADAAMHRAKAAGRDTVVID
jgi:diguanylate cyclase (GGDEF)-like protein